jgi:hypothetical protein
MEKSLLRARLLAPYGENETFKPEIGRKNHMIAERKMSHLNLSTMNVEQRLLAEQ